MPRQKPEPEVLGSPRELLDETDEHRVTVVTVAPKHDRLVARAVGAQWRGADHAAGRIAADGFGVPGGRAIDVVPGMGLMRSQPKTYARPQATERIAGQAPWTLAESGHRG